MVNYRGHLPEVTLVGTSSEAGASLFNLFDTPLKLEGYKYKI